MAEMNTTLQQLLGSQADQIGARIGADPMATQTAISAALPALIAGLQQQANGPGLRQAIEEDHDGSILDDIPGYLQGNANLSPRTTNGTGILDHVLGPNQAGVQQALSAQTGLSMSSISQLLPLLAPIVMGIIGRQARTSGSASGGGLGDLGSILGGLAGASGSSTGGLGDVLGSILGGRR